MASNVLMSFTFSWILFLPIAYFDKIKVNCVLAVRDSFYSLLQQLNFFGNKTWDKKCGELFLFFGTVVTHTFVHKYLKFHLNDEFKLAICEFETIPFLEDYMFVFWRRSSDKISRVLLHRTFLNSWRNIWKTNAPQ